MHSCIRLMATCSWFGLRELRFTEPLMKVIFATGDDEGKKYYLFRSIYIYICIYIYTYAVMSLEAQIPV